MKSAVTCVLSSTQDLIESRKASFELYGADFMLSDDMRWDDMRHETTWGETTWDDMKFDMRHETTWDMRRHKTTWGETTWEIRRHETTCVEMEQWEVDNSQICVERRESVYRLLNTETRTSAKFKWWWLDDGRWWTGILLLKGSTRFLDGKT